MSRCAPVTSGPMSQPRRPSPVRSAAIRSAILRDQRVGDGVRPRPPREIAMHRSPADPNPAFTAASAARSRSASGSTTMWFFAPPSACTRLPWRGPGLVDVPGDRRGADERDRLRRPGGLEQRVDRDLVAVHDVEHAVGQPGLRQSAANQFAGRRVLLARLDDHRVARGDRDREEPHRHHRREVERRDDRRRPRAAGASSSTSTRVETPSE